MKHLENYLEEKLQTGKRFFYKNEARKALGVSNNAFNCSAYRLTKKKKLAHITKNLYVTILPEYAHLGSLPPDQFIDLMMKELETNYYVSLLSAALYHGASHQKPQIFQVITDKQLQNIKIGQVEINFYMRKNLSQIPVEKFKVATGYINISTPEATMMDLLVYCKDAGGLNHIITVFSELVEKIDHKKMIELVTQSKEIAWIQRLGFLLELILKDEFEPKLNDLVKSLKNFIAEKNPLYIGLDRSLTTKSFPRNKDWKIVINYEVESDI